MTTSPEEAVSVKALLQRNAALEATLASERERGNLLEVERDRLRESIRQLQFRLQLLERSIFAAKAHRVDAEQLELEFLQTKLALNALTGQLSGDEPPASPPPSEPKKKASPTGRRNPIDLSRLPLTRIEVTDAEMETLVAQGEATRVSCEESSSLGRRRGGMQHVVTARVTYRQLIDGPGAEKASTLVTAAAPKTILQRSIGTPSLYAHIAIEKYLRGMPLFRQEQRFEEEGCSIDRGTTCRWLRELGSILGASVVAAMRDEAMRTAMCIATDATGVLVQPIRTHEKTRQACKKGHYFVQIADRDHVFFEYTNKETSNNVLELFRGFSGYVQADAKSVYDILFRDHRDDPPIDALPDFSERLEVGCWFHARKGFWEAAITSKEVSAREALFRIRRLFEYEAEWRKHVPEKRKQLRDAKSRPEVQAFFAWADVEFEKVKGQRGYLRSALGYVRNQREALSRYLDDGRLEMDNNRSERALRRIAVGRKAWLFFGSDDHAQSAAHFYSLIASAQLHQLDTEDYLRDVMRVLPHWPKDRYIELAPKYWMATRERLDSDQLDAELGPLTITQG